MSELTREPASKMTADAQTPRTVDQLLEHLRGDPPVSLSDSDAMEIVEYARNLQRELAAVRGQLDEAHKSIRKSNDGFEEYERKYYLEKDRAERAESALSAEAEALRIKWERACERYLSDEQISACEVTSDAARKGG